MSDELFMIRHESDNIFNINNWAVVSVFIINLMKVENHLSNLKCSRLVTYGIARILDRLICADIVVK